MELSTSQLPWRPVNSLSPASPRDSHGQVLTIQTEKLAVHGSADCVFICVCGMHECVFTLTCVKDSVWYCSESLSPVYIEALPEYWACCVDLSSQPTGSRIPWFCLTQVGMTGTHHAHLAFP